MHLDVCRALGGSARTNRRFKPLDRGHGFVVRSDVLYLPNTTPPSSADSPT